MADPLSILIGGGSQAHQQREAQISEAGAKAGQPATPPPQQQPVQNPGSNPATGRPSFLSSVATQAPNTGQSAQKTLLGQ
jgi:hypothetical protein